MSVQDLLAFDSHLFAVILMIGLLVSIIARRDKYSFSGRLLRGIVVLNIVMLVTEVLSWVFDGRSGTLPMIMNYVFNYLFFLLSPIVVSLWTSYFDYKISRDANRVKRRFYYMQPFFIIAILAVINIFTPVVFTISEQNVYSREPFIWAGVAITYILFAYVLYVLIKERNRLKSRVIIGVLLFITIPLIGAFFQILIYGLLLIWPLTAIGCVIVYIHLETYSGSKDYLTKLYTRVKFEDYITDLLSINKAFTVVMIDLDNFKELNDMYGHKTGDRVLKSFADCIIGIFNNSFICRFGGDEFVIVFDETDVSTIIKRMHMLKNEANQNTCDEEYDIEFSYGYSVSTGCPKSIDALLAEADHTMYENKLSKKN